MPDVLDAFKEWENEILNNPERTLEDKIAELQMAARIDAAQAGD
jgi:hypothetical protein